MPELEHIKSAAKPQATSNRPLSIRARKSSLSSRPHGSRVFAATHIDDASINHGGDHNAKSKEESDKTREPEDLKYAEKAREEDTEEAERGSEDEVEEVPMGVRATRDLESGTELERKKTVRSLKPMKRARDPNLVSDSSADTELLQNVELTHQ